MRTGNTGLQPASQMHLAKSLGNGLQLRNLRPKTQKAATAQEQQQQLATPLDVLLRDCRYLHERTGLDLISTLAPVRDVHDQVLLPFLCNW